MKRHYQTNPSLKYEGCGFIGLAVVIELVGLDKVEYTDGLSARSDSPSQCSGSGERKMLLALDSNHMVLALSGLSTATSKCSSVVVRLVSLVCWVTGIVLSLGGVGRGVTISEGM